MPIVQRLQGSSSETLRARVVNWGTDDLRELALALSTKLEMLPLIARRCDNGIVRLAKEFVDQSRVQRALEREASMSVSDRELPFELLVDVDSFIFESRSAYEIAGKFLMGFFDGILGITLNQNGIRERLSNDGIDCRWIDELQSSRILFFHNRAPWIAVEVDDASRLSNLIVLKSYGGDGKDPNNRLHVDQLRNIYQNFAQSMSRIQRWIMDEIEAFEEREKT